MTNAFRGEFSISWSWFANCGIVLSASVSMITLLMLPSLVQSYRPWTTGPCIDLQKKEKYILERKFAKQIDQHRSIWLIMRYNLFLRFFDESIDFVMLLSQKLYPIGVSSKYHGKPWYVWFSNRQIT